MKDDKRVYIEKGHFQAKETEEISCYGDSLEVLLTEEVNL